MSALKKSYKLTLFKNGKFCWKLERTKGLSDNDPKVKTVNFLLLFIGCYFLVDLIVRLFSS